MKFETTYEVCVDLTEGEVFRTYLEDLHTKGEDR